MLTVGKFLTHNYEGLSNVSYQNLRLRFILTVVCITENSNLCSPLYGQIWLLNGQVAGAFFKLSTCAFSIIIRRMCTGICEKIMMIENVSRVLVTLKLFRFVTGHKSGASCVSQVGRNLRRLPSFSLWPCRSFTAQYLRYNSQFLTHNYERSSNVLHEHLRHR